MSQESKQAILNFLRWKELGNWEPLHEPSEIASAKNPLCGDEIFLQFEKTGDSAKVIALGGDSCSICSASAGLVFQRAEHWTEASISGFKNKIEQFLFSEETLTDISIDETTFWNIVKENPSRHRCAILPLQAIQNIFKRDK